MNATSVELAERFRQVMARDAERLGDGPLLVAVSGGLDSVVLLHLLRFAARDSKRPLHLVHVDHGLRTGSRRDADWTAGLGRAWGVPVHSERVEVVGRSEESARNARYASLEKVKREVGATWVALGHHADDQAETVLHRIARGTGLSGLSGMARFREPGIWRPLISFWREDLEVYARRHGMTWCTDESNADLSFARNSLRHVVLPELEARVAPAARRALVRLAELAESDGEAWAAVMPILAERVDVQRSEGLRSVSLDSYCALDSGLKLRLARALSAEIGLSLDRTGTRLAVEFSSSSRSGQQIVVTGGLLVRRELDRLVFGLAEKVEDDVPLVIPDGRSGFGDVVLSGHVHKVEWGEEDAVGISGSCFTVEGPRYPLTVRARRDGDRIELAYGSKKLNKLFLEARLPEPKRGTCPVLVDADGRVLWVPGLAEATKRKAPVGGEDSLKIGIVDANAD